LKQKAPLVCNLGSSQMEAPFQPEPLKGLGLERALSRARGLGRSEARALKLRLIGLKDSATMIVA